jgi:hypothetical protein
MGNLGKAIGRSAAVLLISAGLLLSGCASFERMIAPGPEEETAGLVRPEKPDTLPPFENEYSREGLIKALVQFQEFSAMAESLQPYLWGDRIFEDRLAAVAWLEAGPYAPGRSVTLAVYNEDGVQYAEIIRGLVQEVPGKGRWWRFSYQSGDTYFTCEYFTDLNAVPRQILLKNNASGERVSREPFYTEMLAESPTASGAEPQSGPPAWFDQLRREEYQAQLNPLYAGMEILGEEAQLIDGRWIRAVHMRSGSADKALHAWFSPDVPGRLLRIKRSDDHVIAEVVERRSGYKAQLSQR